MRGPSSFPEKRPSDLVATQFDALRRISKALGTAEIDYWVFGGWAVDLYVGRITRLHDDIDLAVWLVDLPCIRAILHEEDWAHAPGPDDDGGTGFELAGVRLELTFLERDAHGQVFIPMRNGRVAWASTSLGNDVREVEGVRVRILRLADLARGKSSPRADPDEAAKDRSDYDHLSRLDSSTP